MKQNTLNINLDRKLWLNHMYHKRDDVLKIQQDAD